MEDATNVTSSGFDVTTSVTTETPEVTSGPDPGTGNTSMGPGLTSVLDLLNATPSGDLTTHLSSDLDLNLTFAANATSDPSVPRFSSMEIWFIATGSVILAVIVLFCLNACIHCKVCEKVSRCFRHRNHMTRVERRVHTDLEAKYDKDESKTRTHLFLHRLLFKDS